MLYNNYIIDNIELNLLKNKYNILVYIPQNKLFSKSEIGSLANLDVFYQGLTWAKTENCEILIKLDCDYLIEGDIKTALYENIKNTDSIVFGYNDNELSSISCKFLALYIPSWTLNYPMACLNFYIKNEITVYLDIWFYELIKTLSGNNKSKKWITYNTSLDYLHSGICQLKKD